MEIVTRKVKSLLKKVEDPNAEKFDIFMHGVLTSFLTNELSSEQVKVVVALLQKEGYLA
jgi:hypothetical protein